MTAAAWQDLVGQDAAADPVARAAAAARRTPARLSSGPPGRTRPRHLYNHQYV